MAKLGFFNTLEVVKSLDFGVYLDGEELGEILLPRKQVPENCQIGDFLEVFLYHDTERRLIATIFRPHAALEEVGYLKVSIVNEIGAFLEWGIPKDLFVPFHEQRQEMIKGSSYLVYVYFDEISQRIVGSSKLNKFLKKNKLDLGIGQEVDLIIADRTDAGYKAIVNKKAWGFIYQSDLFKKIFEGQQIKGYIKSVREDGKFDLLLEKPGYEKVEDIANRIFMTLQKHGGFMTVNDDSPAGEIKLLFGISKKTFKKAIGLLFRQRRINFIKSGIALPGNPGKQII
ncbi:MAG: GntR family transcriptional regulator [Candidatus Riflebacteria bacterium]|nr:GntR family transcriptional regulator [Candidatus Riflebacteria bacterium]